MKLSASDFAELYDAAFSPCNPGYRREVVEAPNGDNKWDDGKRYAHVAPKYFTKIDNKYENAKVKMTLEHFYREAFKEARRVAVELGIPRAFWPHYDYCALRVLEYPPGAGSNPHKDFNLFTLALYRNAQDQFCYIGPEPSKHQQKVSPGIHLGELYELAKPGSACKANVHQVKSTANFTQYSAVFFAVPDFETPLPGYDNVGDWMERRIAKSRKGGEYSG